MTAQVDTRPEAGDSLLAPLAGSAVRRMRPNTSSSGATLMIKPFDPAVPETARVIVLLASHLATAAMTMLFMVLVLR